MSLPESNSKRNESTVFHFNLRTRRSLSQHLVAFNRECKQELKAQNGHFVAFSYFRQIKDASLKRGYFQKSFVLLTRLPFFNFFYELVSRWAPHFFANGKSSLQLGFNAILSWPNISANASFQLPLLDTIFQIFIPSATNIRSDSLFIKKESATNNSDGSSIAIALSSVNEIDIFGAIHAIINHIQLIWELVLTGEPILVIATSPTGKKTINQSRGV